MNRMRIAIKLNPDVQVFGNEREYSRLNDLLSVDKYRFKQVLGYFIMYALALSFIVISVLNIGKFPPEELYYVEFQVFIFPAIYTSLLVIFLFSMKRRRIKWLLINKTIMATILSGSALYCIAQCFYPLYLTRFLFSAALMTIETAFLPQAEGFLKWPSSYGVTYGWVRYEGFFSVTCTIVALWSYFIGFCLSYPGLNIISKIKKLLIILLATHSLTLVLVAIESIISMGFSVPWSIIHESALSFWIVNALRIFMYALLLPKLYLPKKNKQLTRDKSCK